MPKPKSRLIKSIAAESTINTALANITKVHEQTSAAVDAVSKASKKLAKEGAGLTRKRSTLNRRIVMLKKRIKKSNNADDRKALKSAERELAAVKKQTTKTVALKVKTADELRGLKAQAKRSSAYLAATIKIDKALNKPRKKRRKRRTKSDV